jgi:hypothetical protein
MPLIGGKKKKQEGIGIAPQENTALTPQSIFDPATAQRAAGFEETPAGRTVAYGDGRVRATAGGQEFDMTKEDYEIAMRYKAGMPSSPEQIEAFRKAMGPAFMGVGEKARAGEEEQQRMQELASRIGADPQAQQGMMGEQAGMMMGQRTPLDTRQAWTFALTDPSSIKEMAQFGGGLALAAKFGLAGTKAGAALGPWGMAAGAVGGLALGIYTSYRRNIQQQTTSTMSAQMEAYTQGNQYLRRVEGLINSDPENAAMYLDLANEAEARMRQAWTQMQIDTSTNLNLALGKDGTAQMAKFEEYFRENGMADLYKQRWRIALSAPNQELGVQQLLMASMEMGGEE